MKTLRALAGLALLVTLASHAGAQDRPLTFGVLNQQSASLTAERDLLLTDVVMPGLSGRELAVQLAERRPGLRVLYMSGYTTDAMASDGVLEPEIMFLQKPYSPAALAHKIREVLEVLTGEAAG